MYPFPAGFIVLVSILLSSFFSIFTAALGACRKTRLEKEHKKLYRSALKTTENPEKLSLACRLWSSTLIILAAFFSGRIVIYILAAEAIGNFLSALIISVCVLAFGIIAVLLCDTLPKLISRAAPEKTAALLIVPVKILSIPMMLFVLPSLKIASFLRRIFRLDTDNKNFTEDELRHALMEGEKSGIVESKERTMVEGVFYLGDRPVGAFMTHRSEIQWLDCNAAFEEIREKVLEFRHQQCFPIVSGSQDEIIGVAYLEDIIIDVTQPQPLGLRAIMKKAHFIPETMSALKAFESFRKGQANFLFVMDEYGGLAGVISIRALIEEIVGELSAPLKKEEPLVKQNDGSLLADGTLNIDDAEAALSIALGGGGDFHTLAGFILHLAGELPRAGDCYEYHGYRFQVKEMDGNRIDKLLITKIID